jgi:hypothetical protein
VGSAQDECTRPENVGLQGVEQARKCNSWEGKHGNVGWEEGDWDDPSLHLVWRQAVGVDSRASVPGGVRMVVSRGREAGHRP